MLDAGVGLAMDEEDGVTMLGVYSACGFIVVNKYYPSLVQGSTKKRLEAR